MEMIITVIFYTDHFIARCFEITHEAWEIACMCVIGNEDYSCCFLAGFCHDAYVQKFWKYFTVCDTFQITEFEGLFITRMKVVGDCNFIKEKQKCLIGKKRKLSK
jgi:hypothetical protein